MSNDWGDARDGACDKGGSVAMTFDKSFEGMARDSWSLFNNDFGKFGVS